MKSTLEYTPLLQALLLYTDYQNYRNLELPRDQFFPLVGLLIMNVPGGYRNLSQISDNIPDTFTFLSKISNHNFANQTMVSFDVKSLFTNIPLSFTLNLILESIYVDNTTEWNGLNKSRLLRLLSWSTKNTTFQFNNKFYKQLDGVAIGSPIGPLLADVMMNYMYVINKAIERTALDHQPQFFCRYVDDCFAAFTNTSSIDVFLCNLNSVHGQIQFTKEV